LDETGVPEVLEVLAHRRRGERELIGDLTCEAILLGDEKAEDVDAVGVSERLA